MAVNERFGTVLKVRSLPVASGVVSGQPVQVGSLVGIALTDRASTTLFGGGNPVNYASVALNGAWDVPVAGAVAAAGTPIYITSGGTLTATVGSNVLWGYSIPDTGLGRDGTKGSGTANMTVEISQV